MAMFVDQLSASPHHRLNQILHTLKHVYACELPINDRSQLHEWADQAHSDKKQIVETHTFNSYMQQPAYVKANLILEAVKMLTEVAPKRRKTVKEHEEPARNMLNEGKQKPDFLDVDKDGNKKEPMKQAIKQAKDKKLEEKKHGKPDFLDLDKDGNRKEPMKQAAKQAKNKMDEAKQDPEGDEAIRNYKGPVTYGNTRVAKGAKFHRPGSGHVGRTGSASADAPGMKPTSIKVKGRVLAEDQNLDKAQTLLAAKDITDRLQKMAEDAAKMAVDDLMPLVDTMKDQFGLEQATAFNNVVKQQLQTVLDSIIAAKDQTDNAINTMETGGMPAAPSDIGQPLPPMGGAPADAGMPPAPAMEPGAAPGAEDEIDFEQEFAAQPATSGPEEEPLGRAKKEVAEATLTPAQQKAQAELAKTAAAQMAKTGKKPDGTMATSQERADAKKLMMEKLTKKMTSGEVISDFVHSDDPKFKGKSKAERTKMALGAYYGMHPEKKLKESRAQVRALKQQMDQDVAAYYAHVGTLKESWISQQGDLRSAVLQAKVIVSREQLQEAIAEYKQHKEEFAQHVLMQEQVQTKLRKLEEQMSQTPYGVKGQLPSGATFRKFFESAELRDTWIRYNRTHIQNVKHVTLSEMQQVANRLRKLI